MEGSWLQKLWSPWSRGALGTWICSLTQKLSEPIAQGFYGGFIMETWSTINSVSCPSTVSGDCGIWMEAPTSNPALVFLVTSPHPGVTSLRQETLLSHRKFQGIQVLCVRTSSCPGNCKGLRSSVSGTRVKDQISEQKVFLTPLGAQSQELEAETKYIYTISLVSIYCSQGMQSLGLQCDTHTGAIRQGQAIMPSPVNSGRQQHWCGAVCINEALSFQTVRAEELLDGIQDKIPTFQGLKFSDTDLLDFGQCVDQNHQRQFALLFGVDEVSHTLAYTSR